MAWNLAKGDKFLPGISLAQLRKLYRSEKGAKAKQRLLCAVHRKEGESIDSIKEAMQMPRRTIHDILRRFDDRGIKAKLDEKRSGRPPLLTPRQRMKLARELEVGPPYNKNGLWTTKEASDLLRRKYKVKFVNQHVWRILRGMGFTLQRPRKRHHKAA